MRFIYKQTGVWVCICYGSGFNGDDMNFEFSIFNGFLILFDWRNPIGVNRAMEEIAESIMVTGSSMISVFHSIFWGTPLKGLVKRIDSSSFDRLHGHLFIEQVDARKKFEVFTIGTRQDWLELMEESLKYFSENSSFLHFDSESSNPHGSFVDPFEQPVLQRVKKRWLSIGFNFGSQHQIVILLNWLETGLSVEEMSTKFYQNR